MTAPTWDQMRAERDRLLAAETAPKREGAIARMHARHGVNSAARCGDCAHFFKHRGDYQVQPFKCHRYAVTNGAASDWRLSWVACGLFEAREAT